MSFFYEAHYSEPSRYTTAIFLILCAMPILTTLLFGGVDAISLGILSLLVGIIVCLWMAESLRSGAFRFSNHPLLLPLLVLIALGSIQLLPFGDPGVSPGVLSTEATRALSLDAFATRFFIINLCVCSVFFAAAFTFIDSKKRARRVTYVVAIFGSVIAFFGVLQRLADPEGIYGMRPTPQAISFGPFVNQHHFAAMMELTAGLVLGLLLGSGLKRDRKAFLLIAAILMSIALFFTGSRGGVISFAGVIAFVTAATYFLPAKKNTGRRGQETDPKIHRLVFLTAAVVLSLLVIGLVFYLGAGDSLLRGFGFQEQNVDVSSGRIHIWKTGIDIFLANPLIGTGLDTFGTAFSRFDTNSGAFRIEQAHNDYLQMLTDGGIIGFGCVAVFIWLLFSNGIRAVARSTDPLVRSMRIGALAGCLGIAIHSFFDFPLRTPSNALFFLLLAVLATNGAIDEDHGPLTH